MKFSSLIRSLFVLCVVVIATVSFAFIKDPRKGLSPKHEMTESQRASQQALQKVTGPVGKTPAVQGADVIPLKPSQPAATSALLAVANVGETEADAAPKKTDSGPAAVATGPFGALGIGIAAFAVFWVIGRRDR